MILSNMRDKFADLCHRQWSGWVSYLFEKCTQNEDGTMTIPKWAVNRWRRQMSTDYIDLSEEEKNTDRSEADKYISLFESGPNDPNPFVPGDSVKIICHHCEKSVNATFKLGDCRGIKSVLLLYCDECNKLVAIPQQSVKKIKNGV